MLLEVNKLKAGYSKREVVHGASITVDKAEIVALIGHNGAGKTTTLKGIFGLIKPMGGNVLYNGANITGHSANANMKNGITFTPQERFVFPDLSVKENLDLGGYVTKSKDGAQSKLDMIYQLYPILKERQGQRAGTLSGGERRMLGIGMALMAGPQLLLLDEPSLGLSPLFVQTLMSTLQQIQQSLGTAILIVEQNVKQVLRVAHRVYAMKMGRIIVEESAAKLLSQGQWWDLF